MSEKRQLRLLWSRVVTGLSKEYRIDAWLADIEYTLELFDEFPLSVNTEHPHINAEVYETPGPPELKSLVYR